jgi:hypothetical protein
MVDFKKSVSKLKTATRAIRNNKMAIAMVAIGAANAVAGNADSKIALDSPDVKKTEINQIQNYSYRVIITKPGDKNQQKLRDVVLTTLKDLEKSTGWVRDVLSKYNMEIVVSDSVGDGANGLYISDSANANKIFINDDYGYKINGFSQIFVRKKNIESLKETIIHELIHRQQHAAFADTLYKFKNSVYTRLSPGQVAELRLFTEFDAFVKSHNFIKRVDPVKIQNDMVVYVPDELKYYVDKNGRVNSKAFKKVFGDIDLDSAIYVSQVGMSDNEFNLFLQKVGNVGPFANNTYSLAQIKYMRKIIKSRLTKQMKMEIIAEQTIKDVWKKVDEFSDKLIKEKPMWKDWTEAEFNKYKEMNETAVIETNKINKVYER